MDPRPEFTGTPRFALERRLGAGGMGVVYQAFDREKNATVALKVLRNVDGAALARFKNEFRALQDISHENLVSLEELQCHDGHWFFTMELVEGVDLLGYVRGGRRARTATDLARRQAPTADDPSPSADTLRADSFARSTPRTAPAAPADERRLRHSLGQLASALVAFHGAGIIHRDIKPSNVLVTAAGRAVLLDFGLMTRTDGGESTERYAVGTAAYMAPEQAAGRSITPAADWYAFGVLLYEALTGRAPFAGAPIEVLMKKQQYAPPPPRAVVGDAPVYLDRLCEELLRVEPSTRPTGPEVLERLGVSTAAAQPLTALSTPPQFSQSIPFVGREAELARLRAAFDASRKRAVVAIVEGASGLGKSELVARFTGALAREVPELVTLEGRCYERESVPYKALDGVADTLSHYLRKIPKVEAAALMPLRAALLPRLFPTLQRVEALSRAPLGPEIADPQELRLCMFDALRELLAKLAELRPLVMVIDDLQWTDADSLTLLHEILAHEDAPRLLLITTRRPIASESKRHALEAVDEMATGNLIELGPLPEDQASELARLLVPGQDDAHVAAIVHEAGGHPLFLHELARQSDRDAERAASLDGMLSERVAQLLPVHRHLLEVVCVAGNPINQEIAAEAAELEYADCLKAVAALRMAYLVRTDGMRRGDQIAAYHDRVREVVTGHLQPGKARLIHERLAIALQLSGAAASNPHALVRHAQASGDRARAAGYAEAAASHAVAAAAFDRASQFLQTAIELGDHDRSKTRALQLALADALGNAGRGPEAAELFASVADDADGPERADCRRRAAEHWIKSGHIERGVRAMEELLEEAGTRMPASPRRALASLLWQRTVLRFGGLRWRNRPESELPASVLGRVDLFTALAQGLSTVDTVRGADFQSRSLRFALRAGEPKRVGRSLFLEVGYRATRGRRAARNTHKLRRLAADIAPDDPYLKGWYWASGGFTDYFCSRFASAAEQFGNAARSLQTVPGATWERDSSRLFQLFALYRMGKLTAAEPLLTAYVRDAARRGDLYIRTTLIRYCHIAWLARGDITRARRALDQASWAPPTGRYHLQHWYHFRARMEMALYTGQVDWVAAEAEFAAVAASLLPRVVSIRLDVRWLRGRLALAAIDDSGNTAAMCKQARRMARKLERENDVFASTSATLLRAAVATHNGDRPGAIALLERGESLAASADLLLQAASAHRRRGQLVGGDDGAALIAEADDIFADEGVRDPAAMTEVFAPGFAVTD